LAVLVSLFNFPITNSALKSTTKFVHDR